MIRVFYLVIISLLFFNTSKAQTLSEKIDNYLNTELEKFNIPNVSVVVVDKQNVLYLREFGEKTSKSNSFYIGSVSKSLTAFAVLKLIDKKHLSFERNVSEIIPNLKFSKIKEPITIRQLLNHTTGISKKDGFKKLPTLKELEGNEFLVELKAIPGTQFEYSNLNYSILGLIIEKISGKTYQEFMRQEVFLPFEMSTASAKTKEESNTVQQYQYLGGPIKVGQINYDVTAIPAGFITCSAQELSNYLMMNLNDGKFKSRQLINSNLLNIMHTPWNETEYGYAMGWKQGKFNNKRMLQHLGTTPTSNSGIFIFPEDNIGLIVLTNTNSMWFTEELMKGLLHIVTVNESSPTSSFERYFRYGILLTIICVFAFFMYRALRIIKSKQKWNIKNETRKIIIHITLIVLLFIGFPAILKIPFTAFFNFQPDIGFFISLLLIAPILLMLLKISINLTNNR